ncbi:MAG: formate--tetrahydrofolate ligase [Christensenellaceae bacterium]|jgi:formate--tetrahydrofolate ligase
MKTDIQIAQEANALPITQVAKQLGIQEEALFPYGSNKAKINPTAVEQNHNGKLVLVTAITPTPAGEGKTTISTGLADGMRRIGKNCVLTLREPSLGPVFGMKGGATGGGYAQVLPMEEINLHFTGDFHAITTANNLLAAMVDNHIFQGNALQIDPNRVVFRRCLDVNDRQLRTIESGLDGKKSGVPRTDGFDITAASEIMAILCLAKDMADLKRRLSKIIVGYTKENTPICAEDIGAVGAMAVLLKDALHPNLVQTLEGTPCLMHGGPFANIAHGCNSVIATKTARALGDYVITEAGFGADLGAEKFFDIKCRQADLVPDAVVLVATIRALKYHGGVKKDSLNEENLEALKEGTANLFAHLERIQTVYKLPVVIAINAFSADTPAELALLQELSAKKDVWAVICEAWAKGGAGSEALAEAVVTLLEENPANDFSYAYTDQASLQEKIHAVAQKIYGASTVSFSETALEKINTLDAAYAQFPICIAKIQYSFSDDPKKLGAPSDFTLHVRDIHVSAGAEFIVVYAGTIIAMPGLPKVPAAINIDVSKDGVITGLF